MSVKGDCDEELKELLTDIDESDSLFLLELSNEFAPIDMNSQHISSTFDVKESKMDSSKQGDSHWIRNSRVTPSFVTVSARRSRWRTHSDVHLLIDCSRSLYQIPV